MGGLTKNTAAIILFSWATAAWSQVQERSHVCGDRGLSLRDLTGVIAHVENKLYGMDLGLKEEPVHRGEVLTWHDVDANLHPDGSFGCDRVKFTGRFYADTSKALPGEGVEICRLSAEVHYDTPFTRDGEDGFASLKIGDHAEESFGVSDLTRDCVSLHCTENCDRTFPQE